MPLKIAPTILVLRVYYIFKKNPRKKLLAYCPKTAPFFPISSKNPFGNIASFSLHCDFLILRVLALFFEGKGASFFVCAVQTLKAENPHIL